MTDIILDTNIYDHLREDVQTRDRLARLVAQGHLRVVATPKVVDELTEGPFGGLPTWFPISTLPESIAVLGHWRLGQASLGEGKVYSDHRGSSKKDADAIIANSASSLAGLAVSEDNRFRKRLVKLNTSCAAMNYDEFRNWLFLAKRHLPTSY